PAERALDGRSGRPLDTEALRTDGTAVAVRVHVGSADAPLTCCRIPAVFIYGTLLRGQSRHGAIRRYAPESTVPATCPRRLVELRAYPRPRAPPPARPRTAPRPRSAPASTLPAPCPGRVVELGAYPGLLLDSAGRRSTVH